MLVLILSYLCAKVVWESTEQRAGTTDELRTLGAAMAMTLILGGTAYLVG